MKDSEVRGIVLERFYDARHKVEWLSLDALSTHVTVQWTQLANICEQLGQHGLITWKALKELHGTATGMGRITAHGVDVVEETARAPITITLHHDQSIKVSGSTNVQIGNSNTQNVQNQLGELVDIIDKMNAAPREKQEAKSLIEKITSNPLVVAAWGTVLGKTLGQ